MSRIQQRRWASATAVAAMAILSAAWPSGSSWAGSSGTTTAPAKYTLTIGVLTDVTGLAASTEKTVPLGVKAGVGLAGTEGYHLKYVVADAGTSPTTVLAAAQKLVDQDHVFAVVAISAVAFSAAPFLTSRGVPVVGASIDGTEWTTAKNMFSVDGTEDYHKVYAQAGNFFKHEGVTNVAAVGYGISPSSALATTGAAASAKAVGLHAGYVNANFPFGGTNVGPEAVAIKGAGANGLFAGVETNTSFSLIQALRQEGAHLKVALLPIGYGGDLLSAGPGAQQAAQGVYFEDIVEPVEMHTAATEKFQHAVRTYAGSKVEPDLNEALAYMSVDAIVTGLKADGGSPSQSRFIDAMLKINHYTGAGLYGTHAVGFTMAQRGQVMGNQICTWMTRFSGTSFHLVTGADPVCGALIPGQHV